MPCVVKTLTKGEDPMAQQGFKRKHGALLAADVVGYGPLMNDINIRSLKGGDSICQKKF